MKKLFFSLIAAALTAFGGEFTLSSNDLAGQLTNTQVANNFGCDGRNISPELHWSNAPKNTKSFAVTVYDPDAPTGSGWWHWIVFDIDASTYSIPADFGDTTKTHSVHAIQSITDAGKAGFFGACPPKGDRAHRYIFTVFALDTAHLGLDKNASPAQVGFVLTMHTIAKSSLISYYKR